MVDFRYHLVTIIAIFLALALGIIVGTTQLNGQVLDDLNARIDGLAAEKRDLEATIGQQRARTDSDVALLEQFASTIVAEKLLGERVVLVSTPNASGEARADLISLLQAAGATVGTQVTLRPDLIDPTERAKVESVVDRAATPGLNRDGGPLRVAARALAGALLAPIAAGGELVSDEQAAATLAAFARADLIDVANTQPRGTMVVLLTGEQVDGRDRDAVRARSEALLTVASELDARGAGVVLAGPLPATEQDGLIRALRADDDLDDDISSVDGVGKPQGRIATVLALREQRAGETGHYGIGDDSDGPLPSLSE